MKVTFIIKGKAQFWLDDLAARSAEEAFGFLVLAQKESPGITIKIGDGSTRDAVDFNLGVKARGAVSFKLEDRKGYKLATFVF